MAALKRTVEFGIMNKRRGRYFLESVDTVTRDGRKVVKKVVNQQPLDKELAVRAIKRKLRRKKRRAMKPKRGRDLRRSLREPTAFRHLRKTRNPSAPNPYKFFELYVNPCCRMSAKSSIASTQMLEQEQTDNCA